MIKNFLKETCPDRDVQRNGLCTTLVTAFENMTGKGEHATKNNFSFFNKQPLAT